MPEIRILHTSDFHDRLTPAKAARLRALKEEHEALLIDSGDAIRAPNVAVMPCRERAISLMNDAGYDAMGLGNREYFFRNRGMAWKTGHARFPRVCTNLRAAKGSLPGIEPWAVLTSPSGVRVGLLSIMPTMIAPGHWFEHVSDNRFFDWLEAAHEAVEGLRDQTDVIVALVHRPPDDLPPLLERCPDIRLFLAGHAHRVPAGIERVGGVPVSFAGEGATRARLIALRSPDGIVTMDRLIALD